MPHRRPSLPAPDLDYWRSQATGSTVIKLDDIPDSPAASDFKLLAENLPTLCWIARGDGYIYWYNKRFYDYSGTTPDAMEGWGWQSLHDPDELPRVMKNWTQSIATGEPYEMIFPLRAHDGIYRRFLTRIVPVRNESGVVVRWIGTNTEIENYLRTEEALAVSEAKFGVLTDAMPQMVWSTLPDGTHDYYNAQWYEFTGAPYGSIDGDHWVDMFHPDDQPKTLKRWRRSLQTGKPYDAEYRLRHHSGEYRWTLARALPVRNEQGNIIRWIGTCTDIDDAKRNAQQTELLSRELSHRIKNIFAVIGGLIGLSAHREPEHEDFANRLAGRISALGRAHDFARPHGGASGHYSDFAGLHGMLAELLAPYEVDGRIAVGGDDVRIDERSATPLALVIHELATNAVKYGALSVMNGRVEIVTGLQGDTVTIRWKEHGGPRISTPPEETGFGTQLSDISIKDQLGGKIERIWNADGLEVILTIDPSRLCANLTEPPVETT
ncbi:MAG: PAS domain-containing protein [Sphingorhabdus sp.]